MVAVTDAEGRFEIQNAPTEAVVVKASARGYLDGRAAEKDGRVRIELEPSLEIHGVATFSDGTPVPGLRVLADRAEAKEGERRSFSSPGTSPDGRFVIEVSFPKT